jgi:multicomponent K+:H+ antiporter subunit D
VLVLDRLSALMLVLTSVLGLAALLYSLARWHRAGPRFHTIFQFQLMGLNGAFLTGDLFNLFVFFEVLLAASYGLACTETGIAAGQGGSAYIAINLTGSFLFLIGVSLAYGVTGTLNMADLAAADSRPCPRRTASAGSGRRRSSARLPDEGGHVAAQLLAPDDLRGRLRTGRGRSSPCMSKVGVYVILRLWTAGVRPRGGPALPGSAATWTARHSGMLTIAFGAIGVLASQALPRLAGCSVLISSGTLHRGPRDR